MSTLYDRNTTCPICSAGFSSKKIKRSAIALERRDTDYCAYYKGDNPMYYSIFVCPSCGFASFESEFKQVGELSNRFKDQFRKKVTQSWRGKEFSGVRTLDQAEETYKLALITYTALEYKKSAIAKVCLRLAWLYRYNANEEKELTFLSYAKDYFIDAFQHEDLASDKENELVTMLLIGEISRRLGDYTLAVKWFDKLLKDPDVKRKRHIELRARDLWYEASEAYKTEKVQSVI